MKTPLLLSALLLSFPMIPAAQDAATTTPATAGSAEATTAPGELKWETNMDDPPIGDPERAIRGGTLTEDTPGYPKTFRPYGPNANEIWANYRAGYMQSVALVERHPQTDRYIPMMATHWSIQPDNKTVYYKLNPEVRWNDGRPITADDYVFAFEAFQSEHLVDPAMKKYAADYYEKVKAVDPLTLKVTGKQPSWRPLDDYTIPPLPRHAMKLDAGWVTRDNYVYPVTQGPYKIDRVVQGERVELVRLKDWWGDKHRYTRGMHNPDRIIIRVIEDTDRAFDFFRRGELDVLRINTARMWATQLTPEAFPEFRNNWVRKRQLYVDTPQGLYGISMNLKFPLFQNKNFRKALQHLLNFDKLNKELMFNSYFRAISAFEGTMYENKNLKPMTFDPKKAREYLTAAGFTKRGADGILVNDKNQRAAFRLSYGSKGLERHLTVIQNDFKRAGIEMTLQPLESATSFERVREKATEAFMVSMTASFYPDPHQYFSSTFADKPQTNNFWSYANPEVDKLIDIYRFNMNAEERIKAMVRLDEIIQEEAFIIPFWSSAFLRFIYWDHIEFPKYFYPKRAENHLLYPTLWINPEKQKALQQAKKANRPLSPDPIPVEVDPHGVKPQ